MHHILIIDDDEPLTEILGEYLQQQQYQVTTANSPLKGIELLKQQVYDLLLLDVMMPDIDGFSVLTELRKFSKIPVIMLTAKGDDYDKILGLELGADDYLPKPFNQRELVARIKALIRRLSPDGILTGQTLLSSSNIHLNMGNQEVRANGHILEMTSTEFVLLTELVRNKGHLISKDQLCQRVLGRRLTPFDRSLDMHVSNLRKKLALHGIKDKIKTVRGTGYLFKSDSA